MKGSKEFFEELRNGQEWLSCLMTKECYSGLEFEARERIAVTSVRQKNDLFTEDEEHKDLVKKYKVSGYPTLIILKPDQKESKRASGYQSVTNTLQLLNSSTL